MKPEPIGLDDLRALLLAEERPALWLLPTDQPSFSKIGGLPDLEADFEWPSVPKCEPMAFIAQIDLAQARAVGGPDWLPETGALYFFALPESIYEGKGGRVIYRPAPPSGSQARCPGGHVFPERRVRFEPHPSYPELDWFNISSRTHDLDEDDLEPLLAKLTSGRDEDDHRFGGYPTPVQGGHIALECELLAEGRQAERDAVYDDDVLLETVNREATSKWRMLLQIDSDDALKMNWVDAGKIWFFIREDDARAGDFSQVQYYIQFC